MKLKIAVTGVTGRMGSALVRTVRDDSKLQLVGGTERKGHAAVGLDVGLAAHLGALEAPVVDDLKKLLTGCDAVIDFTSPEASVEHAAACAKAGVALVVGSTGFSDEAKREIGRFALSIPVVMSPNMSVGVNVLLGLVEMAAQALGEGFDVEIVEAHHRLKRDSPSGTALKLAEVIATALGRKLPEVVNYGRQGEVGARTAQEIGVLAVRGGDVVGDHTAYFLGLGERIEITHRASSRETFARGAVRAALWLGDRDPGLYDMRDVLGLRR